MSEATEHLWSGRGPNLHQLNDWAAPPGCRGCQCCRMPSQGYPLGATEELGPLTFLACSDKHLPSGPLRHLYPDLSFLLTGPQSTYRTCW